MKKKLWRLKYVCILSGLFIILIFIYPAFTQKEPLSITSGIHYQSINYKNRQREYIIYLPDGYNKSKQYPVILNFHGGGGNASNHMRYGDMNAIADKYGFIVVYPDGTGAALMPKLKTWNSGDNCCGKARKINSDDVGFTSAIIDDIEKKFNANPNRIYSTGMSNGAMMSYRLACELSGKIAAIAPVSGTLNLTTCSPKRPVPILHFHGMEDQNCRFDGGIGKNSISKANFKSVPYSIDTWKKINQCSNETVIIYQKGQATCYKFESCKGKADVILCKIKGMGHTWPGVKTKLPELLGPNSFDINASETMWDFFKHRTLK